MYPAKKVLFSSSFITFCYGRTLEFKHYYSVSSRNVLNQYRYVSFYESKKFIVTMSNDQDVYSDWLLWAKFNVMSCIGVFPKWNKNSVNSTISINLLNPWGMNWGQFKDPVSHLFLASAVVASKSLSQEVADSNPFNNNMSLNSLNSVKTFRKNSNVMSCFESYTR